MNNFMTVMAFTILSILVGGCAKNSDYVLPEKARKLTAEEISNVFSNAREEYESIDDPGLTATAFLISDGTFRANWTKGWFFDGSVKGEWYTEDDQLCVKTSTKIDGSDLYCTSIYELDGVYTSVHPDGSYQGISTLTSLGDVIDSKQLYRDFIGNTLRGSYYDKSEKFNSWYYFDEDGTIFGRDDKDGKFRATWEIRDGGCLYTEHPIKKYNGCYYYVHESGNSYRFHRPWSDNVGHEILVEGNPENLGE